MSGAGKLFIWYRRKRISPHLTSWKPRVVFPNVYVTNMQHVFRIRDVDLGRIRTAADRRHWEWDMSSAQFRARVEKCVRRVRDDKLPAFEPCPRVFGDYWESMEDFRNEGPCRKRWVYLLTLDDHWDVTPVDEHVGPVCYENRPFQMTYECVTSGSDPQQGVCQCAGRPQVQEPRRALGGVSGR